MSQPDFMKLLALEKPALHDEADVDAALAAVPPPRSPGMLLEKLRSLGVTPGDLVVDLGCGHGQYAREIAGTTGCTVIALDMSRERVAEAREEGLRAGAGAVHVARAVAQAIPLPDAAAGFIWCRDMPNTIEPGVFGECARVLRPGGRVLVYQTFATGQLEPRERQRLFGAFAIDPDSMDAARFESAARDAGFTIAERDVVGGEWREWWEEDGSRKTSASLLRASRLLRGADAVKSLAGEEAYEFALADQLWGIYQMIGKLQPVVYVLRREP